MHDTCAYTLFRTWKFSVPFSERVIIMFIDCKRMCRALMGDMGAGINRSGCLFFSVVDNVLRVIRCPEHPFQWRSYHGSRHDNGFLGTRYPRYTTASVTFQSGEWVRSQGLSMCAEKTFPFPGSCFVLGHMVRCIAAVFTFCVYKIGWVVPLPFWFYLPIEANYCDWYYRWLEYSVIMYYCNKFKCLLSSFKLWGSNHTSLCLDQHAVLSG